MNRPSHIMTLEQCIIAGQLYSRFMRMANEETNIDKIQVLHEAALDCVGAFCGSEPWQLAFQQCLRNAIDAEKDKRYTTPKTTS